MRIIPWLPLPAGTLLGVTAFCTVMVNWAVTASTVKFCGVVVWVSVGAAVAVPVMVMV